MRGADRSMNTISLMESIPNWPRFYRALCRFGPVALTGVPRGWVSRLQLHASSTDLFWSDGMHETLTAYWNEPPTAVERVMELFTENVRREFEEFPFSAWGSWQRSPNSDELLPMSVCVDQIGFKLTHRLTRALIRASQSPYPLRKHVLVSDHARVATSCDMTEQQLASLKFKRWAKPKFRQPPSEFVVA